MMMWFRHRHVGMFGLVASGLILLAVVSDIEAKRGCFAYGHSCLGGLGKRAGLDEMGKSSGGNNGADDETVGPLPRYEMGGAAQQQEVYYDSPPVNVNELRQQQQQQHQQQKLTVEQLYQLSPFIRQLIRSMRANQELNISDV